MSSIPSHSADFPSTSAPQKACSICGTTTNVGIGYGVISCKPCKQYFAVSLNKAFIPKKCEGKCVVSHATKMCRYCRFNKCLMMGMKKEKSQVFECQVCGDLHTPSTLNVCLNCKAFFHKRDFSKNPVCLFSGNCTIMKKDRNNCKACRYQKCLDAGLVRKEDKKKKTGNPSEANLAQAQNVLNSDYETSQNKIYEEEELEIFTRKPQENHVFQTNYSRQSVIREAPTQKTGFEEGKFKIFTPASLNPAAVPEETPQNEPSSQPTCSKVEKHLEVGPAPKIQPFCIPDPKTNRATFSQQDSPAKTTVEEEHSNTSTSSHQNLAEVPTKPQETPVLQHARDTAEEDFYLRASEVDDYNRICLEEMKLKKMMAKFRVPKTQQSLASASVKDQERLSAENSSQPSCSTSNTASEAVSTPQVPENISEPSVSGIVPKDQKLKTFIEPKMFGISNESKRAPKKEVSKNSQSRPDTPYLMYLNADGSQPSCSTAPSSRTIPDKEKYGNFSIRKAVLTGRATNQQKFSQSGKSSYSSTKKEEDVGFQAPGTQAHLIPIQNIERSNVTPHVQTPARRHDLDRAVNDKEESTQQAKNDRNLGSIASIPSCSDTISQVHPTSQAFETQPRELLFPKKKDVSVTLHSSNLAEKAQDLEAEQSKITQVDSELKRKRMGFEEEEGSNLAKRLKLCSLSPVVGPSDVKEAAKGENPSIKPSSNDVNNDDFDTDQSSKAPEADVVVEDYEDLIVDDDDYEYVSDHDENDDVEYVEARSSKVSMDDDIEFLDFVPATKSKRDNDVEIIDPVTKARPVEEEEDIEVDINFYYAPIWPTSHRALENITYEWLEDKASKSIPHIIEAYKKGTKCYKCGNRTESLVTTIIKKDKRSSEYRSKLCNEFFRKFTKDALLISPMIRETPLHLLPTEDKEILLKKNLFSTFLLYCLEGFSESGFSFSNEKFVDASDLKLILRPRLEGYISQYTRKIKKLEMSEEEMALFIVLVFCQTDEMEYEEKMTEKGLAYLKKVEKFYKKALFEKVDQREDSEDFKIDIKKAMHYLNLISWEFKYQVEYYLKQVNKYKFPRFFREAFPISQK